MSEMREYTVGELVVNYDRLRKPLSSREREKRKGIYPYYGATCIFDYVDDYIFDGEYILMGEDGTVINPDGSPVLQRISGKTWVNNHAHVLQNTSIIDFDYLYYALKNTNVTGAVTGAVQPKISQANMNALKISIHTSIAEQQKVASVLKRIDEKIEQNTRINNNLLEQAVALYNKMCPFSIDSDLPQDWRVGTVGEIVDIHDSKRIPLSGKERDQMENKIYPYYGAASLMDFVDNYIFDGKYLLLGEDGTVVDDKGYPILQYVWGKFWVNNHAHILTGSNGFNVESLYVLFKQTSVASIVTGAVQPKISQANLRSIKVVIPPKPIIESYNDQVEPIFSLIRTNEDFNSSLIQVRDALLPKLMSGELDVSTVEI